MGREELQFGKDGELRGGGGGEYRRTISSTVEDDGPRSSSSESVRMTGQYRRSGTWSFVGARAKLRKWHLCVPPPSQGYDQWHGVSSVGASIEERTNKDDSEVGQDNKR